MLREKAQSEVAAERHHVKLHQALDKRKEKRLARELARDDSKKHEEIMAVRFQHMQAEMEQNLKNKEKARQNHGIWLRDETDHWSFTVKDKADRVNSDTLYKQNYAMMLGLKESNDVSVFNARWKQSTGQNNNGLELHWTRADPFTLPDVFHPSSFTPQLMGSGSSRGKGGGGGSSVGGKSSNSSISSAAGKNSKSSSGKIKGNKQAAAADSVEFDEEPLFDDTLENNSSSKRLTVANSSGAGDGDASMFASLFAPNPSSTKDAGSTGNASRTAGQGISSTSSKIKRNVGSKSTDIILDVQYEDENDAELEGEEDLDEMLREMSRMLRLPSGAQTSSAESSRLK